MSDFPSELRRGSLNNRWVLIASGRANRPHDWNDAPATATKRDPFVPKNIPRADITDQIPNDDKTKYSVASDWKAISIKNAFPVLSDGDGAKARLRGDVLDGYGYHELIIHSPEEHINFEDFTPEQTQAVLELYLKRYNHLSHMPNVKHVQIFTNRGPEAGASVTHPHTQVVALPIVPPYITELVDAANKHYDSYSCSVAAEEALKESDAAVRVIYENPHFIVYCPYAPHANYHIRIMPKQPGSYFHEITQVQLETLAKVIGLCFRRLNRIAGVPPYNMFIRTAPVHAKNLRGFRWHIDIIPHLSTPGGLELSTELDVVTVTPEDAAHALRQDI